MFKESNEARELARYFIDTFKLKANQGYFFKQMNIAKTLLDKYKYKDLTECIDYLYVNRPRGDMYSLGLLIYIVDETIPKAKTYAQRDIVQNKGYELSEVKKVDNVQKKNKKKSIFK